MRSRRQIITSSVALAALPGLAFADVAASKNDSDTIEGAYDWQSVPFAGGGFIDGFVFHPREKGLLYARTDIGGAYRFDPAAKAWVPLLDHLPKADADLMGVLSLAVDPNDANRLYAACGLYLGQWARDAAVLYSNDRGATWQKTELGLKLAGNGGGRGTGERLQVDPNAGDIVMLGTTENGLMVSRDAGRSFTKLGFPAKHVSLVLFDAKSGAPGTPSKTIYAGAHDAKPGLYVSNDGGASFALEPGAPEQVPQRAAFAPDGTLYVTFAIGEGAWPTNPGNAKTGGVWKREPGGKWANISPMKPGGSNPNFGYSGLDVDLSRPGRLVVSTIERWVGGDDAYLSTDGGANWIALGARSKHDNSRYPWLQAYMRGEDKMGHWIADIKLDPQDGNTAIYGTGYGLWMTHNLNAAETAGGVVNWDFTNDNLEETAVLELKSPSGGATLLAAMGDVSGAAWDHLTKTPAAGVFLPGGETNRSIDFAELNPGIMARVADQAATGGYWSGDGAVSWKPFGPSPRQVKNAKGEYLTAGKIAVSAKGTSFVWTPEKQAALFSIDHGKTWKESSGWPTYRDVALTPVADRFIDGVFYVLDRNNSQILISVDHGQSFNPVIKGLPKIEGWQQASLIAAPGAARDLWLLLPDSLTHLAPPGQPTKLIKPVIAPWKFALGKAAVGAGYHSLYVWGKVSVRGKETEGLFRSDDLGGTWVRINDDRHRFGALTEMTADPLEYGTVYIAPHGRGVIVGRPRKAG